MRTDEQLKVESYGPCFVAFLIEHGMAEGFWPLSLTQRGKYYLHNRQGGLVAQDFFQKARAQMESSHKRKAFEAKLATARQREKQCR